MNNQLLKDIPHANTQKNVNKAVFEHLLAEIDTKKTFKWLDIPCGAGELLDFAHKIYPNAVLNGADIALLTPKRDFVNFKQVDLSKEIAFETNEKFDLITSVSGVMMFGNTQFFVENISQNLAENAKIIISNDNCFTIRDRLSYLFLGRLRRFKLFFEKTDGLTQLVPQQEIYRLLDKNNISVKSVIYTSFYTEDLLFLPFFLLILPFQYFYLMKIKSEIPKKIRWQMFGWKSLLFRHYFFVGEKNK